MTPLLAFQWFTLDHGHLLLGVVITALFCKAVRDWPTSAWIAAGVCIGVAGLALTAHFLHWWR